MKQYLYSIKPTLLISIIFSLYILSELIFTLLDIGCQTSGCVATKSLIFIPELALLILALFYSTLLIYLQVSKENYLNLFKLLVFSGLLFETLIFAYQLKNNLFCIFCFGVWTQLILLSLFTFKEQVFYIILPLFVIIFGINVLNTDIVYTNKEKNIVFQSEITLLGYEDCPFCKQTKEYLNTNKIKYDYIDTKKHDVSQFLRFVNWDTVPVAIFKKGEKTFIIKKGFDEIKKEIETNKQPFNNLNLLPKTLTTQKSIFEETNKDKEDNCKIDEQCK